MLSANLSAGQSQGEQKDSGFIAPHGCIKLARSADFQSAVSLVSNLPISKHASGLGVSTPC